MLAQNFKSAADLGITEPQFDALRKTLVLLETGKLRHVPSDEIKGDIDPANAKFGGCFSMDRWAGFHTCGTACCIGGTAEIVGKVTFENRIEAGKLTELFYPSFHITGPWDRITPSEAATALRSYLTTGDARWDLAVA